jgi:hypothetical protein
MNYRISTIRIFSSFLLLLILNSCLSVAKISDFPRSSKEIDFDRYSAEYKEQTNPFWTASTSNEYYFERYKILTEKDLTSIIQQALSQRGYQIIKVDLQNNYINSKRGMQANEWNSITSVYFQLNNNKKLQVYIITKITQDFTGGWKENRAREIGEIIENNIDQTQ